MSITSLTCHNSQSLPFPLCSHFHAEQTFLQIPSSPETGPNTHSCISTSSWLPCGRRSPIPHQSCTGLSLPRYQVLLVQPSLTDHGVLVAVPLECAPLQLPGLYPPLRFATTDLSQRHIPSTWPRQGAGISSGLVTWTQKRCQGRLPSTRKIHEYNVIIEIAIRIPTALSLQVNNPHALEKPGQEPPLLRHYQ